MKLLRPLTLLLFFAIFCGLTLLAAWSHQNKEIYPTGKAATNWRPLINPYRSNEGVVAYYSFQDEQLHKGQIRNRKTIFPTSRSDFKFFQDPIPCRVVEGRWPGKRAVELDKGSIRLPTTGVSGSTFAIGFWIRHTGLGSISGGNFQNAASIMAAGNGVWNGWRIDLLFPSNRIVFNIARKRGEPTVGVVSALRIPPRTWTHVAVSREPTRIRIYVNGILTGETQHNILPPPLSAGSGLLLGYVGNGLSSSLVQFDDLMVFSQIPPISTFLSLSQLETIQEQPFGDLWEKINQSFTSRDYDGAIQQLQQSKRLLPVNSMLAHWIDFRLGEASFRLNKRDIALQYFLDIRRCQNAPESLRMLALHEYLLICEGVDSNSDPEFYAYSSPMNFEPHYGDIAPASYRYINASSDYDNYTPFNESQMQKVN